jgi:hypothetical protein
MNIGQSKAAVALFLAEACGTVFLLNEPMMSTPIKVLCLITLPLFVHCKSWGKFWDSESVSANASTTCSASRIPAAPAFARSTTTAAVVSTFLAAAADCDGNVYAAGHQINQTVSYSAAVSVTGAADGFATAVLVKYNSAGEALWGQAAISPLRACRFNAVAVDRSGNIYAAGYQTDTIAISYGNGVTAQGSTTGNNPMLVKYNASGAAQWARTIYSGTANAQFNGVATDASGNIYATGYQFTTQTFDYGSGVTVTGGAGSENAMLVKYDSTGKTLWGKSTGAGSANTVFNAIAVDADARIYAGGHQFAGSAPNYGSGTVAAGCSGNCSVLVRYDTAGNTIWGFSASGAGLSNSTFTTVAADSDGNIYAGGSQNDNMAYNYNGASVAASLNGQANVVLVRYNSSGSGIWARSLTAAVASSLFYSISTDTAGNIYAGGYQNNNGTYTYGPGVSAAGFTASSNAVLVKYRSDGIAEWVRTVTNGGGASEFNAVTVDAAGNVYTSGYQAINSTYTYGNLLSVAGAYNAGNNAVLLKFTP